jgi:hypothetical protein
MRGSPAARQIVKKKDERRADGVRRCGGKYQYIAEIKIPVVHMGNKSGSGGQ